MSIIKFRYPSQEMLGYLHILFNDLEFTQEQRNAFVSEMFSRRIKYLDSLTFNEARYLTEKLKLMKEEKK